MKKNYKRNEPKIYEMIPVEELLKSHKISANQITKRCSLKNGQISNMIHHPNKNVSLHTMEQFMIALGLTSFDQLLRKQKKSE